MFRKSRSQRSLLESEWLVPKPKRQRLEQSWSKQFNSLILPLIDEQPFRVCFKEDNGRPNASIRLLVAVELLKQFGDLTDEEAIEQVEFNLQWQHALGLEPDEAHLCQKTMHNFRRRVVEHGLHETVFASLTKRIVSIEGLYVRLQRTDTTHIASMIAGLTRLGLFVETVTRFLTELRREMPRRFESLPAQYARRYLEREGYFGDVRRGMTRRRLPVAAMDLYRLVTRFEQVEEVRALASYALMKRLLEEQCVVAPAAAPAPSPAAKNCDGPPCEGSAGEPRIEVVEGLDDRPCAETAEEVAEALAGDESPDEPCEGPEGDACARVLEGRDARPCEEPTELPTEAGAALEPRAQEQDGPRGSPAAEAQASEGPAAHAAEEAVRVAVRPAGEVGATSMQSPHDPDATYGHKGKGYSAQFTETCDDENPFQVITCVDVHGAHVSDQLCTVPAVEQLKSDGLLPSELFADTGFGSGENILRCEELGVKLMAPVHGNLKPVGDPAWAVPVEGGAPATSADQPPDQEPSKRKRRDLLSLADFAFAEDLGSLLTCPQGYAPVRQARVDGVIHAELDPAHCKGCPLARRCLARGARAGTRHLRCRPSEIASARRQREQLTTEFRIPYRKRSGIEATNSQIKACGARKLRVRGAPRVKFAIFFKALAVNAMRWIGWRLEEANAAAGSA